MSENDKVNISELPEYIQRMHRELAELTEKIQKCAKFLESDEGKKLELVRRNLLVTQMSSMITYSNVLSLRLSIEIGVVRNSTKPTIITPEMNVKS